MIPKVYLSTTLPSNVSKFFKCLGLYKDKFTVISQASAISELPKSFSYRWNYFNSFIYLQNLSNNTTANAISLNILPNVKKTVVLIEGGIQNNSLSRNIHSYCGSQNLNFVQINGALPFLEDILLLREQKISNDKLKKSLSKIKDEYGDENITLITTNTAFLTSRLNFDMINPKNQIHISPLVNSHSLQFLHHNSKKLLHANCKRAILKEIQDSTNEVSEEQLKKLYELYHTSLKELLAITETPFPAENASSDSSRYFVFSRADEVQPYDPKSLDDSGLTEQDNIYLLNDYSSLMQLSYQQDPIVYLLDNILNPPPSTMAEKS